MKGFLAGLKLGNFLDTTGEVHALSHGFCEVLCPWPPRHKTIGKKLQKEIKTEHTYYMLGRALGILAWLTICCIIKEVLF